VTLFPLLVAAISFIPPSRSPELQLGPCDLAGLSKPAQCGTYVVPERRDLENGRKLSLRVVVVPTVKRQHADPIVFIPGGPGQGAAQLAVTLLKVGGALAGGVALVLLCNHDRGIFAPIQGVPWVVLLVVGVLVIWTILLGRTTLGRYFYAIGGNAEAARRAGVDLVKIRTTAFLLCSLTAGIAGVVYASRLRSISTSIDGGTLVLYAVAAAVIGGTSLFGGRGKAIHGVLGGIVIAGIDNGMGLLGFTAASKYMVTALVLLAAVTIDALSRRGRVAT